MSDRETEATPAIQIMGVTKNFDRGLVRALRGIDLTINEGEWVALTGPSGSGKSTLLHLVAALDKPTSGRILIRGRDLGAFKDLDRYRRLELGIVFQLHNLLPNLTAIENVEVVMFENGLSHAEQRRHARELLQAMGIGEREHVRPPGLSGGERQRLAIARALANSPWLLLADEPTGSLDSVATKNVLELFRRIQREQGLTVLMVTHDEAVAEQAERIVDIRDGQIVSDTKTVNARK